MCKFRLHGFVVEDCEAQSSGLKFLGLNASPRGSKRMSIGTNDQLLRLIDGFDRTWNNPVPVISRPPKKLPQRVTLIGKPKD